jgi:DNA-binding NarL/FixJ family response regulator
VITVVLIDDHEMFVESLGRVLRTDDIEVVGTAGTMTMGIELTLEKRPAVVVVDYRLPDGDGIEVTRRVRALAPDTRILMLTASQDEQVLIGAIDAGCSGFVTKDKAVSELVQAVRLASVGDSYIAPRLLASLLPRMGDRGHVVGADLTKRERDILWLVAEGLTNQAIAQRVMLSVHTVRNHIQNILTKLEAHSKLEAVAVATRAGLLRDDDRPG